MVYTCTMIRTGLCYDTDRPYGVLFRPNSNKQSLAFPHAGRLMWPMQEGAFQDQLHTRNHAWNEFDLALLAPFVSLLFVFTYTDR